MDIQITCLFICLFIYSIFKILLHAIFVKPNAHIFLELFGSVVKFCYKISKIVTFF